MTVINLYIKQPTGATLELGEVPAHTVERLDIIRVDSKMGTRAFTLTREDAEAVRTWLSAYLDGDKA